MPAPSPRKASAHAGVFIAASALLIALALLATGCGSPSEPPAPESSARQPVTFEPTAPKNLLMIVLDTTTARRWSLYGHPRETTPFITQRAKNAVVFERAYSQATATVPSTWSFMMGQYIYRVEEKPRILGMRKGIDIPLALHFRRAKFATGGFSDNSWIRKAYGFGKGFDSFETTPTTMHGAKGMFARDETGSERVLANAQEFLSSVGDQKFFCYVHFLRPHNWYVSPEPYLSRFFDPDAPDGASLADLARQEEQRISSAYLRGEMPSQEDVQSLGDLYDGNVAYSDHLVEELYKTLDAIGARDETMVIIMSDHGEAFMEHGKLLHSSEPYDELIHVPLVIDAPESAGFVPGRVSDLVELVDIEPTLQELFGLRVRHRLDGLSLLPHLRATATETPARTIIAESINTSTISVRQGPLKQLTRMDEHYQEVLGYELYNMDLDPGEQNNLFTSVEEIAPLVKMVTDYNASRESGESFSTEELTEEEQEQLKAMGYLE